MKVAAVQMKAALGNVRVNMDAARSLASQAFSQGAELVILPEFFTSAMAFHPVMQGAAQPLDGPPLQLLKDLARDHQGTVGGSFIAVRNQNAYNTFALAFPDGSVFFHDKDQPTMWENCYYVGGDDDGVLDTPLGPLGSALCWEFVRTRTAKRLRGRVNLVIGGSCWWSLPTVRLPGLSPHLADTMLEIMKETPGRMARLVGAPVVHAAHAGNFSGRMPLIPGIPYDSHLVGQTQITDALGKVLAKMDREDGEGCILADLDFAQGPQAPSEPIPTGFWIPRIPRRVRAVWSYQNVHGRWYYRLKLRPGLKRGSIKEAGHV